MRKTPFAGITRLDPDESLLTDGGAFIGDDRDAIDYFLRLGAKTHRHDGSTGLDNPLQVASGGMAVQGGSLPADLSFGLGYTLVDENGGETMISPVVTISTAPPVSPPTAQATATVDYAGGSLLVGTYYYAVSLVDNTGGETPVGPAATASRAPGHASGRITVSDLADDITGNIVAWRLYRSVGGGDFNLLATGTGNTFVDDGSQSVDCDITPNTDAVNTTNGQNLLIVRLPSAVGDAEQINMYVSEDGSFAGDALLDTYPAASAGASAIYPTIELGDQAPPATNRSVGGAERIDAEQDIINLHWLAPVANFGALPDDAEEGDVRVVLATGVAYLYRSGDWDALAGGGSGGGGGGGSLTVEDQNANSWPDVERLFFAGSGVYVETAESAEGGVQVLVGQQIDHIMRYGAIESSVITASGMGDVEIQAWDLLGQSGTGAQIMRINTDIPARIRLYSNDTDRAADEDRPMDEYPEGDHGLQLEVVTTPDLLATRLSPPAQWWHDGGMETFYFKVTNLTDTDDTVLIELAAVMNILAN